MRTESASVRVPEGYERDGGYVVLSHGQTYTLMLHNNRNEDADVGLEIDGKQVGEWRVGAKQTIRLERPVDDTGRFTFFAKGTPEFESAQLSESDPNLGLVKATFKFGSYVRPLQVVSDKWVYPKYEYTVTPDWTYYPSTTTYRVTTDANSESVTASVNTMALSSGGTGLTGKSNQNFYTVSPLSYDPALETIIYLRLVLGGDTVRPLRSTPIPPRVD